jgi:pyrimidine-nucleoside phosphorylase/thymidine phosphorylase
VLDLREFLRCKRDGGTHTPEAVLAFVDGFVRGEVPDYQASAWLMAAYLNGLDEAETDALTRGLLHSGRVFDWSALGRPTADKHSTGGVGDKVSLILAPLAAACGLAVPMVSGRGLGHTGGTLDKLESIPGFRTRLDPDAMRRQLDRIGVVMVGQGPDLAPADGRLYALRDVTSTVEREYFIVPSIVSKKVGEGAKAVVYDVKCGGGAFMKTREAARSLARRLVATTRALGTASAARVTDMSQPLGRAVGNALEVRESIELLRGRGPADVRALTLELTACMLTLAGLERSESAALDRATRALDSGAAWGVFLDLVEAQGGDRASVEPERDRLPRADVVVPLLAPRDGVLAEVDCFRLGERLVSAGAGRIHVEDPVDPRVGMVVHRRIGDRVATGDVLAELHLAAPDDSLVAGTRSCFRIGAGPVAEPPLVLEKVD